jgi:hypothetical protein
MKSVITDDGLKDILSRLEKLSCDTVPEWGSMNAAQMLSHCTVSLRLAFNEIEPEHNEKYLAIGKMVKNQLFDTDVFMKNIPTTKEFLNTEREDFAKNKIVFVEYLKRFSATDINFKGTGKHPYFGLLNMDEWGKLIYKHTNHHLVQFGI